MILNNDRYKMDWTEGAVKWGTVKCPKTLVCKINRKTEGEIVYERYTFTNISKKDVFTSLKDISIYTPFNDDYTDAGTCMTNRCHTHIWCGEDISYIMALRMGGEPPHLGLVLTEGSIGGYSVERDLSRSSNDRGDFLLHPSPVSLAPEESFTVGWILFPHTGKKDFYRKLGEYCGRYIDVCTERYLVFQNERIHITIRPVFDFTAEDVKIVRSGGAAYVKAADGKAVDFQIDEGAIIIDEKPDVIGEYCYHIQIKGVKTHCNILVQPEFEALLRARCEFIVRNQQYHKADSGLDGAYLIYDRKEKHLYYDARNDYNGGRERICMGILLARYLLAHRDDTIKRSQGVPADAMERSEGISADTLTRSEGIPADTLIRSESVTTDTMKKSLEQYIHYVERELFDRETGEVFNDYGCDNSYRRPYNYPWVSLFYLELYSLYGRAEYLENAYKIMKAFYVKEGGTHFYAIEIPLERILTELGNAGMKHEHDELMEYFKEHCHFILERGTNYPAHEVNFEQSIVAPAANLLLQMYRVTENGEYLEGAKRQLEVLELFNGLQPDYHLYEVAIRHWDGYWFGKRQLYGDTYPHYWSALTANAYQTYAEITGSAEYAERADAAYRGVLSMFFPDGSASCAYVYPVSVNGIDAGYYDEYANDQDWGMYFMLRK